MSAGRARRGVRDRVVELRGGCPHDGVGIVRGRRSFTGTQCQREARRGPGKPDRARRPRAGVGRPSGSSRRARPRDASQGRVVAVDRRPARVRPLRRRRRLLSAADRHALYALRLSDGRICDARHRARRRSADHRAAGRRLPGRPRRGDASCGAAQRDAEASSDGGRSERARAHRPSDRDESHQRNRHGRQARRVRRPRPRRQLRQGSLLEHPVALRRSADRARRANLPPNARSRRDHERRHRGRARGLDDPLRHEHARSRGLDHRLRGVGRRPADFERSTGGRARRATRTLSPSPSREAQARRSSHSCRPGGARRASPARTAASSRSRPTAGAWPHFTRTARS